MGNKAPVGDVRVQQCAELMKLTKQDIADFSAIFQTRDHGNAGTISSTDFFSIICEKKSTFGLSIFELVDVEDLDKIEFGEFLQAVVTYCLFETVEVLKFIFFIYDREKTGLIAQDELRFFISGIHEKESLDGNLGRAFRSVIWNEDGKLDFSEFQKLHKEFPAILFPCFRLQESMMINIKGQSWWKMKKAELMFEKEADLRLLDKQRKAKLRKLTAERTKQVKAELGTFGYWFNVARHAEMQELYPEPTMEDVIAEELAQAQLDEEKGLK